MHLFFPAVHFWKHWKRLLFPFITLNFLNFGQQFNQFINSHSCPLTQESDKWQIVCHETLTNVEHDVFLCFPQKNFSIAWLMEGRYSGKKKVLTWQFWLMQAHASCFIQISNHHLNIGLICLCNHSNALTSHLHNQKMTKFWLISEYSYASKCFDWFIRWQINYSSVQKSLNV